MCGIVLHLLKTLTYRFLTSFAVLLLHLEIIHNNMKQFYSDQNKKKLVYVKDSEFEFTLVSPVV